MPTALLVGATGLIGHSLLPKLLASSNYDEVLVVTRRPLQDVAAVSHCSEHPKLKQIVVDFAELDEHAAALQADDVFCCLGTTQKQHGGGDEGRAGLMRVDHDYVLSVADIALQNGAQQFLHVSALAANSQSSIHYNKVKGLAEDSLKRLSYPSLHIFQPSLLLGDRDAVRPQDMRGGESFWQKVLPAFNVLLPGKLSRYQPTPVYRVAQAMLDTALQEKTGTHTYRFYNNKVTE